MKMIFCTKRSALIIALITVGFLVSWKYPSGIWFSVIADLVFLYFLYYDYKTLRTSKLCEVSRTVDEILQIRAKEKVTITITNVSDINFFIEVYDEPPSEFITEFSSKTAVSESASESSIVYEVMPSARGIFEFRNIIVRYKTRLGLLMRQINYSAKQFVQVYPNIKDVDKCSFLSPKSKYNISGILTRKLRGASLEFESLRDYSHDDEPSRIDWKATAKKGKPISKEYTMEENQYIVIAIDHGRTMASRLNNLSKTDIAVNSASLLAYVAAYFSDKISLVTFTDEITSYLPPGKGKNQAKLVMKTLSAIEPVMVESDYKKVCSFINSQTTRRALVIFFTDIIDPDSSKQLISSLGMLKNRHRVLCISLSDYEIEDIMRNYPKNPDSLYELTVATILQRDRIEALKKLKSLNIITLDAKPSDLSIKAVNSYMRLKERGFS